jgi:hypothetical protein
MNITFVTMMYGIGLPVLFPVAALSMFTLYMMEKAMIYYVYSRDEVIVCSRLCDYPTIEAPSKILSLATEHRRLPVHVPTSPEAFTRRQ